MNEVEQLREWMEEKGYSTSDLAKAMGFSYDGVYQALKVRKYFSANFKWCFQETFGSEEASKVFATNPQPEPAEVA
ncbi:MAG: hypothetical protein IT328_09570 [Caldilineaceae bacterium]|nr:hypothetical protein [Caldilineaceae bacterium]